MGNHEEKLNLFPACTTKKGWKDGKICYFHRYVLFVWALNTLVPFGCLLNHNLLDSCHGIKKQETMSIMVQLVTANIILHLLAYPWKLVSWFDSLPTGLPAYLYWGEIIHLLSTMDISVTCPWWRNDPGMTLPNNLLQSGKRQPLMSASQGLWKWWWCQANGFGVDSGLPKRKGLSSNHQFSGAMLVSGRVNNSIFWDKMLPTTEKVPGGTWIGIFPQFFSRKSQNLQLGLVFVFFWISWNHHSFQ